jgi:hypothetical protein
MQIPKSIVVLTRTAAFFVASAAFGVWLVVSGVLSAIIDKGQMPPVDPPPPLHGGSLAAFAEQEWQEDIADEKYPKSVYYTTLSYYPNTLFLYGVNQTFSPNRVIQSGKDAVAQYDLKSFSFKRIVSNWTVTLDYRDQYGKEDNNTQLQICTHLVAGACDLSPEKSRLKDDTSMTIYLVGNLFKNPNPPNSNPPFSINGADDNVENDGGRFGLHYDVGCGGPLDPPTPQPNPSPASTSSKTDEPHYRNRCNHIFTVTTSGLLTAFPLWPWPISTPPAKYHCVDGACDFVISDIKYRLIDLIR